MQKCIWMHQLSHGWDICKITITSRKALIYYITIFLYIAANNASNFLESSLRYLDEQLLFDILPRGTCPGEEAEAPLDEFPEVFTRKF